MPDLINYKERCKRCFSNLQGADFCAPCTFFPPVFKQIRFIWDYQSKAREVISIMKYRPSLMLTRLASKILAQELAQLTNFCHWDLLVPVPSSSQSRKIREFNVCVVLAQTLGLPFHTGVLKHLGYKDVQASLTHAQRIKNIKHAFSADCELVSNKKILLLEDVITTGATSNAAATALLNAGAASVDLLALARAPVWSEFRFQIFKSFNQSRVKKSCAKSQTSA